MLSSIKKPRMSRNMGVLHHMIIVLFVSSDSTQRTPRDTLGTLREHLESLKDKLQHPEEKIS